MSLMLANRYFLERRDELAIPYFSEYLKRHPGDRQASHRLAASLLRAGRVQEADVRLEGLEPLEPEGVILRLLCRLHLNGEEDACTFLHERSAGMDWLSWWSSKSGWVKAFVQEFWDLWSEAFLGPSKLTEGFLQWLLQSLGPKTTPPAVDEGMRNQYKRKDQKR